MSDRPIVYNSDGQPTEFTDERAEEQIASIEQAIGDQPDVFDGVHGALLAEVHRLRHLLAVTTQALWDVRRELGFDNDGDPTPAAQISGGGVERFARSVVDDALETPS